MKFIERHHAKFREMPRHYKAAAVVAALAWAARTALWPIGGVDLYNEFHAIDHFEWHEIFNYDGLSNKALAYGIAWIALKAIQWGAVVYIGYGYYRSRRAEPGAS